jgi:hypothetical protein
MQEDGVEIIDTSSIPDKKVTKPNLLRPTAAKE